MKKEITMKIEDLFKKLTDGLVPYKANNMLNLEIFQKVELTKSQFCSMTITEKTCIIRKGVASKQKIISMSLSTYFVQLKANLKQLLLNKSSIHQDKDAFIQTLSVLKQGYEKMQQQLVQIKLKSSEEEIDCKWSERIMSNSLFIHKLFEQAPFFKDFIEKFQYSFFSESQFQHLLTTAAPFSKDLNLQAKYKTSTNTSSKKKRKKKRKQNILCSNNKQTVEENDCCNDYKTIVDFLGRMKIGEEREMCNVKKNWESKINK